MEPPKWFFDKPELLPGQEFYINSFDRLSTTRSFGQGAVGRIPWTAVTQYAQAFELDWNEYLLFQEIILLLDTLYVEWVADRVNKDGDD